MIAHEAATYYLNQPNAFSVVDVRAKFKGDIRIIKGKPYIVFSDESTHSIEKIVLAKFNPQRERERADLSQQNRLIGSAPCYLIMVPNRNQQGN